MSGTWRLWMRPRASPNKGLETFRFPPLACHVYKSGNHPEETPWPKPYPKLK
jgi:hypothetical protein